MASTKSDRSGNNLTYRITPTEHRDGRVEAMLKIRGAAYARVLFDPRQVKTREELNRCIVQFVTGLNAALARAQRNELSRGPTLVEDE
jgi:hypothetical protein